MRDRTRHGWQPARGQNCNAVKTEEQVHEIRSLRGRLPSKQIACRFGVSLGCIKTIFAGRSWGWLPVQENDS